MPHPMEILLKQKRDEASLAAMSNGLRRKQDIGYLSTLSGDPTLGKLGTGLQGQVDSRLKAKLLSDEKAAQRDMTQGYYDQMSDQFGQAQEHRGKVLTEAIRSNKEKERLMGLKASRGMMKAPSQSAVKATNQTVQAATNISALTDKFKNDYGTDIGFGEGTWSNFMGKTPMGSEKQTEQALWWSEYQQLYELGTRNELFGSALTDSEIRAWKKANISENSTGAQIREGLAIMAEVARNKAAQQYLSDSQLYYPDWVNSVYGPMMGGGGGEAPPSPEGNVSSQGFSYTVNE